jgi:hypothetical protein
VCADGGFVIVGDFLPDFPTRRRYHHRPDEQVFTYKQDYAALFTTTSLYSMVSRATFDHDAPGKLPDGRSRGAVSLLAKSLDGFYCVDAATL